MKMLFVFEGRLEFVDVENVVNGEFCLVLIDRMYFWVGFWVGVKELVIIYS